MEENVKNQWLAKIKSGKVAVIESHYAPKNNTNCIWLKDGVMYAFGNSGWEPLGEGGSKGGGGFITTPVNFDEIKMSTGDTPLAYAKAEADGILFNPAERTDVTIKYVLEPVNPKGTRSLKNATLDDITTQTYFISSGSLVQHSEMIYDELLSYGFSENVIGVVRYTSKDGYGDSGFIITTVVDNGKSYVVITDPKNNVGLASYYDNPNFRGITIEKHEEEPEPEPSPAETA